MKDCPTCSEAMAQLEAAKRELAEWKRWMNGMGPVETLTAERDDLRAELENARRHIAGVEGTVIGLQRHVVAVIDERDEARRERDEALQEHGRAQSDAFLFKAERDEAITRAEQGEEAALHYAGKLGACEADLADARRKALEEAAWIVTHQSNAITTVQESAALILAHSKCPHPAHDNIRGICQRCGLSVRALTPTPEEPTEEKP